MDPQIQSQPVQAPPTSFQQPIKKHSGFLGLLGKIVLFVVIAVVLIMGGYFLGTYTKTATLVAVPTPLPTPIPTITPTPTAAPPTPTPASQNTKAVKAGLSGSTLMKPYSIDVPTDWTDARETTITAGLDKLTLTKNGYSLTIYQAAMGGGGCIYKEGDDSIALAQLYTNFVDINGKSGQYRRSWTESTGQTITYNVCQKMKNGSYSLLTTFGTISIVSPNPATAVMLAEVDGMVASLIQQ